MPSNSDSRSESKSNVTDRRIGATDSAIVVAEGSSASFVDPGALVAADRQNARATALAEKAMMGNVEITGKALKTVETTTSRSLDSVDRSLGSVDKANELTADNYDKLLGFAKHHTSESNKLVDTANKALSDVSTHAISKVESSIRSDENLAIRDLIKTAGLVGGAFALAKLARG